MTTWMFQCNPKRYDLLAAAEKGFSDQWSMNQHREAVAVGDRIYFFISGPAAGIYVVAQVVSPVYESKEPDEFGKYKVDVEYTAFVDPYIPRSILTDAATEPILAAYVPFKGQQQTNFLLPPDVAARLDALSATRQRPIPKKPWQGADMSLYAVDTAVKAHEKQVRAQLLAALKDLDPFVLQDVIGRLFGKIGYEDWAVTKMGGDMGIDVTATLRVGGVTEVPTIIQVKRFTSRNVDGAVVRELRGALASGQHGVIVTTSGFTKDAVTEAKAAAKTPIALVDGNDLVDLMVRNGFGVHTRPVPLFTLNLEDLVAGGGPDA